MHGDLNLLPLVYIDNIKFSTNNSCSVVPTESVQRLKYGKLFFFIANLFNFVSPPDFQLTTSSVDKLKTVKHADTPFWSIHYPLSNFFQ